MKRILTAAIAACLLSACAITPATQGKIDTGSQMACLGMEAADGVFDACAATVGFPEHDFCAAHVTDEAQVYAGIKAYCTPPYTLDPQTLIAKAAQAAKDIAALTSKPAQ